MKKDNKSSAIFDNSTRGVSSEGENMTTCVMYDRDNNPITDLNGNISNDVIDPSLTQKRLQK